MKKSVFFLVLVLTLAMLAPIVPVSAYDSVGEAIENYDKYGYYTYFDFENYGSPDTHLDYVKSDYSTNADGLLCNPFGLIADSGSAKGTGKIVKEEGNSYYSYTQGGTKNDDLIAAFSLQPANGRNLLVGDAVELSFRFRLSETQNMTASDRLIVVNVRRAGTIKGAVYADIYGNLYAYSAGNNNATNLVYKNGDGATVGGDGEFMDISFKWYDVTNTYSLSVGGNTVVEAMPLNLDFRESAYVTNTYNDDFGIENRTVVGDTRAIELLRANSATATFSYEVDDVKLARLETAQQGAYYYENSFDAGWNALISRYTRNNTYRFSSGISSTNLKSVTDSTTGSKCLYVAGGHYFGLVDDIYQQFTQGSYVVEFDIKAKPTHTNTSKKALVSVEDGSLNTINMLWADKDGALYLENGGSTLIPGYKLDGTSWLHVALVATRYEENAGKFGTFKSGTTESSQDQTYVYSCYINGNFCGTAQAQTVYEWKITSTEDNGVSTGITSSNRNITITHTEGALNPNGLTVVDSTTTANHIIYKNSDGNIYYDVEYDTDGTTELRYSTMTVASAANGSQDTLKFFAAATFEGYLDNIEVYEGTSPKCVYEGLNSSDGAVLFDVDFGHFGLSTNSTRAYVKASGADNIGTFLTSKLIASDITRGIDEDGIAYANMNLRDWFDFFVPVVKQIDGKQHTVYSFETTVKNLEITGLMRLFSSRFENNSGSYSTNPLMSVDANLNLWAGSKTYKLCDKDGNQIVLDNGNWNRLRADVSISKNGTANAEVYITYYYNGEPCYLEDGSLAYNVTYSYLVDVIRQHYGTSNYRLRFSQKSSSDTISFDIKSIKISAKAAPTYISADNANFNNKVTVFELNVPKYDNSDALGRYDAFSLKKRTGGVDYTLPLVAVDFFTDSISLGYASQYYDLYDAEGNAVTVNSTPVPITVVYDDNEGVARYYVNGEIAYIYVNGELTPAVDLVVYDYDFARLNSVNKSGYMFFIGHGTNDNAGFETSDYGVTSANISNGDTAKVIGFQENGITNGLRIISGVDTLYYNKVGFEMETFVGGVSKGIKDISDNIVFSSVVGEDKTVTPEQYGYNYFSALSVTELPKTITEKTYIEIRSYTEIAGIKHYDEKLKIVVTNNGYYFDKDGIIYENDFDGLSSLPSNFVKSGSDSAVALDSDGKIDFDSTANKFSIYYLNQYVGSDYLVQADITVDAATATSRYFGLVGRLQSSSKYIEAGVRLTGGGWFEADGGGGSLGGFDITNMGLSSLEIGKTYTLSLLCKDSTAVFFIDGIPVGKATIPEGYETGKVGVCTSGVSVSIDNFIVRTADDLDTDYIMYSQNFDGLIEVPTEWKRDEKASRQLKEDFAMSIEDGALKLTDLNSNMTVVALDEVFEYDNFVYEADFTMTEQSAASGVSYYMGPVFGLQDDGRCVLMDMKVTSAQWDIEAWFTNSASSQWKNFASGDYGTTALNTTYRFKLVGADGYVTAYINGVEQAKCEIDDPFLTGKFGIVFRNSVIKVDNVRLYKMIEKYEIKDSEDTATRIRVASFNLGDFSTASGSSGDGIPLGNGTETTKAEYRAVFEKVGADVWGLQEDSQYFNGTTEESPYDAIYNSLPFYERNFTETYNGKAFLSNYEIYATKAVYYNPAYDDEVYPNGTTNYGHKWFWTGKIMVDGKEIALVSLHFDWGCKIRRAQQIKDVIEFADSNEYCIIIGDFNPENYINGTAVKDEDSVNTGSVNMYQIDWKYFTDAGYEPANGGKFGAFETLMNNGVPTGGYPWDNIFVSSNIKILNANPVYESWMDDHAIVVADIEIN